MTAPNQHLDTDLIAFMCKALGHPVRLQIVEYLKTTDESGCGDIVDRLPLAQSTVSQHLKVLKGAGLIRAATDGSRTLYSLNHRALERFKRMIGSI